MSGLSSAHAAPNSRLPVALGDLALGQLDHELQLRRGPLGPSPSDEVGHWCTITSCAG